MLDSILCSAVQAVAKSVLGIYEPGEARKRPDTAAKRLASQLDINSSIQLLKCAQRASTVGINMVSSSDKSTPMSECIDHYTKMFHSPIRFPDVYASRLGQPVSYSASQYATSSTTASE